MFSMLCVADGRRDDLIQIDFADSVNHAYLDIDNEGDTIYVWLMKSTSEIDDVVFVPFIKFVSFLRLKFQKYVLKSKSI